MGISEREINLTPKKRIVAISEDGKPSKQPKRYRTGIILGIIFALLTATGIAAGVIYYNSPRRIEAEAEDVAASALSYLLSSDRVALAGNAKVTLPDDIELDFPDLGAVLVNDGTINIKTAKLNDLYQNQFHDRIYDYLKARISADYNTFVTEECSGEDAASLPICQAALNESISETRNNTLNSLTTGAYNQIGSIFSFTTNHWVEINLPDVLSSDIFPADTKAEREEFSKLYSCAISAINTSTDNSSELVDLYKANPFVSFTEADDSYYRVGLDYTNIANIIKAMPDTSFGQTFSSCSDTSLANGEKTRFLAKRLESESRFYPEILVKLEGSPSHYVSAIKLSASNDAYTLSSEATLTYSDSDQEFPAVEDPIQAATVLNDINQIINEYIERFNSLGYIPRDPQ